jgi:AcrR family transcriptional regulator
VVPDPSTASRAAVAAPDDPSARQLTTQGRERKQQLIDCAAQLFAERGFEETRIKDIVDAAGVAKGLFYWYFDNKEALFAEVAADIRLRLRKHQAEAVDPDAGPLRQIRQGAQASVHFMAENAHFFSLLEAETGAVTQESRRKGTAQHIRDVRSIIVRGQEEGLIVDEDPELLALAVVGTVGYYSHYHRTGRTSVPIDELARFVARAVVRTLAADPDAAAEALAD